jgi:hypothetical protein
LWPAIWAVRNAFTFRKLQIGEFYEAITGNHLSPFVSHADAFWSDGRPTLSMLGSLLQLETNFLKKCLTAIPKETNDNVITSCQGTSKSYTPSPAWAIMMFDARKAAKARGEKVFCIDQKTPSLALWFKRSYMSLGGFQPTDNVSRCFEILQRLGLGF